MTGWFTLSATVLFRTRSLARYTLPYFPQPRSAPNSKSSSLYDIFVPVSGCWIFHGSVADSDFVPTVRSETPGHRRVKSSPRTGRDDDQPLCLLLAVPCAFSLFSELFSVIDVGTVGGVSHRRSSFRSSRGRRCVSFIFVSSPGRCR